MPRAQTMRRVVGALLLGAILLGVLRPTAALACGSADGAPRTVTRIADPAALVLDDGSEAVLKGVLLPSARDAVGAEVDWPAGEEARDALRGLVSGNAVRLGALGTSTDRYGRRRAQVFVSRGGSDLWMQGALIDAGHARAALLPGDHDACAAQLLAREAVARMAMKGLWRQPAYGVRAARDTRSLLRLTGTYQLIEGVVTATGVTRSRIYLNFGRDWRWDFTAVVPLVGASDREGLTARLKRLQGKRVRVRGWIVRRNGPSVELSSPELAEEVPEGSSADLTR